MIRRTLIAIVAAGYCLFAAIPAWATFPGANGRIAFGREPPLAEWDIFTMRPDGSDVRKLQPGIEPSWSANGRWIVYVCYPDTQVFQQICMMRPDGSHAHLVTPGGDPAWDPSFSPGGGRVIFSREGLRTDPGGLFMIDTDGSHEHRLTRNTFGGVWAPDGKHIAYVEPGPEIWLMRPNGSGRRLLYSGGPIRAIRQAAARSSSTRTAPRCRWGAAAPTRTRSTRARSTSMLRYHRPGAAYSAW